MADSKENALLLNSRNRMKWLIESLLGFQYTLNLLHSWRIWCLISMGYSPHRQLKSSLGKNLSLYSPIGAWLMIALVALAHSEFECPRYLSQDPLLAYIGSRRLLSSSHNSKKCCPFRLDAWKAVFQLERMLLHLLFLLNSQDDLQGKRSRGLKHLVSVSTALWRDHSH